MRQRANTASMNRTWTPSPATGCDTVCSQPNPNATQDAKILITMASTEDLLRILLTGPLVADAASAVVGASSLSSHLVEAKKKMNSSSKQNLLPSAEDITKRRLSHQWVFWKDSTKPHNKVGMKTEDFSKHLQKAGHFQTLQELNSLWGKMARYKKLHLYSNIRVFRSPVTPLWEDPNNRDGGRYVILIHHRPTPGGASSTAPPQSGSETDDSGSDSGKFNNLKLPPEYLNIILHVITGLLGPETGFCGIVLSVRRFGMMITVWNTDANDKEYIEAVRQRLATLLNIAPDTITYQRQTKSIRNNVRNLTKGSGTLSSSSSKEDLRDSDSESGESMRRNYSENDISLSKPNLSPWDGMDMPVRRRGVAPQDPHLESIDRKSGLNRPAAKHSSLAGIRKSDPANRILADGADFDAEIRARLYMNVLPHHDDGYSSNDSPFLSPTSSPAPGADPDLAWLTQLRARTPSPPPPGSFQVISGSSSSSPSLTAPTALRAPAPRRLSPEAPTHALLSNGGEKKPSGRRSRKNSRTVSFAPDGAEPRSDKSESPPHSPKEEPVAAPIPTVVVSDTSAAKPKQAPSSPRPRSRSAAVMFAGNFPAPSKDTMDQLTQSPSPTLKPKVARRAVEMFSAPARDSDASPSVPTERADASTVVSRMEAHIPAPEVSQASESESSASSAVPEPTRVLSESNSVPDSGLEQTPVIPISEPTAAIETGSPQIDNTPVVPLPKVQEIEVDSNVAPTPNEIKARRSIGTAPSSVLETTVSHSQEKRGDSPSFYFPLSVAVIAIIVAIFLAWLFG